MMDEPTTYLTLSALIVKLQAIMAEEGDLPVFASGELGEFDLTNDILFVAPAIEPRSWTGRPVYSMSDSMGEEQTFTTPGTPRRLVFNFA